MDGGLIKRKTINGVVTIGGRPIVSPTGNGYIGYKNKLKV